ncbi:hypothetical protein ZOSMA_248G00260 [Zostera marina]|uniref:Transcription repressor n=1 Tax=Zostera marina TaxID=29655 RepID=A0A0K9PIZ2_ZOSMR|nr:hypothetical protein ZOSMA_248G00260 [Zostera marina]
MGRNSKKARTLKSTMKAINKAVAIINPVAPICIHQSRTNSGNSFRNLYPSISFNSIFHTVHSSTSSFASSLSVSFRHQHPQTDTPLVDEDSAQPTTSFSGINSRRFFFSARSTKSIMEEVNFHLGKSTIGDPSRESPESDNDEGYFSQESMQVTINSEDPYRHFRVSMEEMVEAHGLRELHDLRQLLHCYLRLNDGDTHKFILLAFIDILASTTSFIP